MDNDKIVRTKCRKLPIGIQTFSEIIEDGYVYVDKTDMVYKMVTSGKAYFLSRPRRFGKSLLVSTLDAYFNGRKELFTGLAMEQLEHDWKKYPVFRFDMSSTDYQTEGALTDALDAYISEYEAKYGGNPALKTLPLRFAALLKAAHEKTGLRCVILVDEYDKPLLDTDNNEALNTAHRQLFKSFFGNIKKCDEHMKFAFFTGITKFSGVSIFSDLNNLKIISASKEYSTLCGITQQELEDALRLDVQAMADDNGISFDECIARLKKMYDGYHFAPDLIDVYNPFGLLNALDSKQISNFWYEQSTPTILIERLKHNDWNIIDYTEGVNVPFAMLGNIEVDSSDPTPLLYQSGYLTIKSIDDPMGRTCTLTYPNEEVREGFIYAIVPRYLTKRKSINALDIDKFRQDLENAALPALFARLSAVYAGIPYVEGRDPVRFLERDFRNVLHIVFTLLGGIVQCECHFSRGRCDCTVQMTKYVYVFEFKRDKSVDEAIAQIHKMGYDTPFASDEREVLLVGMSFSSALCNIGDWRAVRRDGSVAAQKGDEDEDESEMFYW